MCAQFGLGWGDAEKRCYVSANEALQGLPLKGMQRGMGLFFQLADGSTDRHMIAYVVICCSTRSVSLHFHLQGEKEKY